MVGFDGGQLRVLIIEDNQHIRLLLRTVLHTMGIETILEAHDGEEALAVLRGCPADLLILDWKMEPMDGLSFALKLRRSADSPAPTVPIIMVTAHGEEHLVRKARDAGVDEFLTKPLSAKDLIARISEVMARARPFIRSGDYVGPDRRRRHDPGHASSERRVARDSQ